MVRNVPIISIFPANAGQVWSNPARTKKMRMIVRVLTRLGHRAPPLRLSRHRADILGVAVPAPFSDVDLPPAKFQRGVIRHVDLFLRHGILDRRHGRATALATARLADRAG